MKIAALLLLVLFTACSKNTTKVDSTKPTMPRPDVPCANMQDDLADLLTDKVPELEAIGVPYVKRITEGKSELEFLLEGCPEAEAPDSLRRGYYRMSVGYVVELNYTAWHGFFIRKDLQDIVVYDFTTGISMPLEEARVSQKWIDDWNERKAN